MKFKSHILNILLLRVDFDVIGIHVSANYIYFHTDYSDVNAITNICKVDA